MSDLQDNIKLGYAQGWSFTPLAGKRPTLTGWQKAPREALSDALAWAGAGNVGLRCGSASGGLIVIDLDAGKGDFDKAAVKGLGLPPTPAEAAGGPPNPPWVEWLMGWPIGWTDPRPLAMAKFQSWQRSHSAFLATGFWERRSDPH